MVDEVVSEANHHTSRNAEIAFEVFCSDGYKFLSLEEKKLDAMCCIIQSDISRYATVVLDNAHDGMHGLLWMGDFVSKLLEVEIWFRTKGNPALLGIASRKGHDIEIVKSKLKRLNQKYKIDRVKNYKSYRNKMGSHYDMDALEQLVILRDKEKMEFAKLLESFVGYSFDWYEFLWQEVRAEDNSS